MGVGPWVKRRRGAVLSATALTAATVVVATMAIAYDGSPTTEVDLHDGGVWLTKPQAMLLGHANPTAKLLDGAVLTTTSTFDVQQSGDDVVLLPDDGTAVPVDPGTFRLSPSVQLPPDGLLRIGGSTTAVFGPRDGSVWVMPTAALPTFDANTTPTFKLGADADVAVGPDGTVHGLSTARAEVVSTTVTKLGSVGRPEERRLTAEVGSDATITAVGGTPVVFDPERSLVLAPGMATTVEGAEDGRLQQPSAAARTVLVATASGLAAVPLDGSQPSVTAASTTSGSPVAPVRVDGCAYAVWDGTGEFVRDCPGSDDDLHDVVDGVNEQTRLTFRVNRDAVMLNDLVSGSAWLVAGALQQVDNWDDVTPPNGDSDDQSNSSQTTTVNAPPERTEENTVPVAVPDEFGVRAGRSTVLPVLDNDSDPDGDVLTASLAGPQPGFGDVKPVLNGAALQVAVPADATGSTSFVYQADDGRGGTAVASVALRVVPEEENAPPKQNRSAVVTVEAGASATYNVLPDWSDPDGDDIFLRGASTTSGDEVTTTPDGRLTLRALATASGVVEVDVVVSDGRDEASQKIRFDVRPPGSTAPITNADHVVVNRGETATVSPLANDAATGIEPLRLAQVGEVPGAEIVADYPNKTFTFRSDTLGTTYVGYTATAGTAAATGLVRIDVVEVGGGDLAPIAVRDVALLPAGGDVLVAALANDVDPAGGVLVLQSVSVPEDAGISVSVIGHETIRVTDRAALDRQVRIGYRISNGSQSAEGEVIVIPVPMPSELRPPTVVDDTLTVRVGDVGTVHVLANDVSPSGSRLSLAPDLVEPLPPATMGTAFTSGDAVRFKAGDQPGTVTVSYEAVDEAGQRETGRVVVQVLPLDEAENQSPKPRDLTLRAVAGSSSTVTVPLDGIDPDGDSVELVGIASAPAKGRISAQTETTLTYDAFDGTSGSDSFTYRVRDFLGRDSVATVRVGIAPPEAVHQPPYAVKDAIVVAPGRVVAVDVTANDAASDGGDVELVEAGLEVPEDTGLAAEVVSASQILLTVPATPMETALTYTIVDSRGSTARAPLQVTVSEDVPLAPPIARDDRARVSDIHTDGTVSVDVRANDTDPDGTTAALTVSTSAPGARASADGRITASVQPERQVLEYTVTDPDGLTARAFVFIPAASELRPAVRDGIEPIRVRSGENVRIPLGDYVQTAGGTEPRIVDASKATASHANGDPLVFDQEMLSYTSADGYAGSDAITFEATDGSGSDDPAGRTAMLSLPITVLPSDNGAPVFTSSQITIGAGEPQTSVDLAALTADPDEGDLERMRYELVGAPGSQISARIDGQRLLLSAPKDLVDGVSGVARIRVTDGKSEPVEGTVNITVTVSTRPLPVANDDVVASAAAGERVTVDVLANDVNPYPSIPLKIVGQPVVETGDGTARTDGQTVTVTPAAAFTGTMVVRYRIQDATAKADREADGRIRLTVEGRPNAPGKPVVQEAASRTAVLSWSAPSNNGAPITGYTVRAAGIEQACASTTCSIGGLTNGETYEFTVTATNRVGESDPSPRSDPIRPDERPGAPGTPAAVGGDGFVDLSWAAAPTSGSPVSVYIVEISPAAGGVSQQTVSGPATSLRWSGLANGTQYQFRVRAQNQAVEPSAWSGYGSAVPAGVPATPVAPVPTRQQADDGSPQARLTWTAPANRGAEIDGYRVTVLLGGVVTETHDGIPGNAGSMTLPLAASSNSYTFRVEARNRVGWSAASPPSAPFRSVRAPGAPSDVVLTAGNAQLTVQFVPGALNGANAGEVGYEVRLNGGAWSPIAQGQTIPATNGQQYRAEVRGVVVVDGVGYEGPPSPQSNAATPVGELVPPNVTVSMDASTRTATWTWNLPAQDGRTVTAMWTDLSTGENTQVSVGSGTQSRQLDWGQTAWLRVTIRDSFNTTTSAQASVTAPSQPLGEITASQGGTVSFGVYQLMLTTSGIAPGSYDIVCSNDRGTTISQRISVSGDQTLYTGCNVRPTSDKRVWVTMTMPDGSTRRTPDLTW